MPTKKPRGQELTVEQHLTNQALHSRRLRIEHINSSVKRCRMVKDRIRLYLLYAPSLCDTTYCNINRFRQASCLARPLQGGEKMTAVWASHHEDLVVQ